MANRAPLWAAEAEIEEELQDVDLSHAIGNYTQNGVYDDGEPSTPFTMMFII